jgi:hypothetical protein
MRILLNIVSRDLVNLLLESDAIANIRHDGGDLLLVELHTGDLVAIHLVERDVDVQMVKSVLEMNSRKNIHTLFILWCDMLLPQDGLLYPPYDWMSALLNVYGDKIYAYELEGDSAIFFPVYFERQSSGLARLIRYGEPANMVDLHCAVIRTDGHLNGTWRIADFERIAAQGQTPPPKTPERSTIQAYYDVLEIKRDANRATVRKAYRRLARLYHPDVNKTDSAHERMQQINVAYTRIMEQFDGK